MTLHLFSTFQYFPFLIQVELFKRGNKGDWQELIDKAEKKRAMFDDLLKEEKGEEKVIAS